MSFPRYTEEASEDLVEIGRYIARDNPDAALHVLDEIEIKSRLVGTHPQLGRRREDLAPGLRSFSTGIYVIFYHQLPDGVVEVVRVLHGARDIKTEFE